MGSCTTSINQEALRKELHDRATPREGKDSSPAPERRNMRQGSALQPRRPVVVEHPQGPRLGDFLQRTAIKHAVGIESLYDTLHMGEFRRMDKDLEAHRRNMKNARKYVPTLSDEPLLVGVRVDMTLAQFRAFNRYNQRYRLGKKHVFVAYQNLKVNNGMVGMFKMFPQDNDLANVPEDEENRSQDSGQTSLGSRDSFADHMVQTERSINMNHFIAGYLVPMMQAKNRIEDVSLHVLNDTGDLQDV